MVFVILVSLLLCVLEKLKKKMLALKPSWSAGQEKELMSE